VKSGKHGPKLIARKLQDADRSLAAGLPVVEVERRLGCAGAGVLPMAWPVRRLKADDTKELQHMQ
jgi:hypothetical protein